MEDAMLARIPAIAEPELTAERSTEITRFWDTPVGIPAAKQKVRGSECILPGKPSSFFFHPRLSFAMLLVSDSR